VRLHFAIILSVLCALLTTNVFADSHEVAESCQLLDADNDGVITIVEFSNKKVVLFRSLDPDDDGYIPRQDVLISDEGFGELDRDQDGRVSAYEFVDSKIVSYAALDLDSDGTVSLEECSRYIKELRGGS